MNKMFEKLSKVVAAVVPCLYLVGIIVVTIHLSDIGIWEVSIIRPQYLFAGCLCVIPIVVIAWAYIMFNACWHNPENAGLCKKILVLLLLPFVIIMAIKLAALFIYDSARLYEHSKPWIALKAYLFDMSVFSGFENVIALIVVGTLVFLVKMMRKYWRIVSLGKSLKCYALSAFIGLSALMVMVLFSWVCYFGKCCYAKIPANLGGGKHRQIRLLANRPQIMNAHDSEVSTVTYQLLLETNDRLYLRRPPSNELIVIRNTSDYVCDIEPDIKDLE